MNNTHGRIKQLSIFLENKTGRINTVTSVLAANGVNLLAFSLAESSDFGILRLLVSDSDLAVKVLKDNHVAVKITDVVGLKCANVPGALDKILSYLAEEGVFIEYMYAFADGDISHIVIRPTNVDKCIEILEAHNELRMEL